MIQIELPYPAKILWPNGRGHYMMRHRAFQKHKGWAFCAIKLVVPPCFKYNGERVKWSATFYPKTRHAVDDDNARASLKSYQDGIASALGIDDKFFDAPTVHFAEPVKNGLVVITLPNTEDA